MTTNVKRSHSAATPTNQWGFLDEHYSWWDKVLNALPPESAERAHRLRRAIEQTLIGERREFGFNRFYVANGRQQRDHIVEFEVLRLSTSTYYIQDRQSNTLFRISCGGKLQMLIETAVLAVIGGCRPDKVLIADAFPRDRGYEDETGA